MVKEKVRDLFAVIAIIFALIFSIVLFGVRSQSEYSYNNEYFGREDIYDNWNEGKTHRISLSDCGDSLAIEDGGYYEISGEMEGQVVISGSSKSVYFIRLAGVNISNETGPCILVENASKVILELSEGSENLLKMGATDVSESGDENLDGAIYSKDDLTIRGTGKLSVTGNYSHGIVCNDKLVFAGGDIEINAKNDGVHANDLIAIRESTLDITAGDDGITVKNDNCTGVFYGESGDITVRDCYEGIEADEIIIENGKYTLFPTDDGINAMTTVDIRDGEIRIENTLGKDADGIDSNNDVLISGGNIYISLPQGNMNMPIDYGEENGGKLSVTGGNIEAYVGGESVDAVEMSGQGFGGGKPDKFGGGMPGGFDGGMPGGFDGEIPGEFDGGMPGGFDDQAPEGSEGERPEPPDGNMSERPDGDMPKHPDGDMPGKFGGHRDSGNAPKAPDVNSYATPSGE